MRLHDVESAVLLPRFAHNAEWEQNALDQVVKGVRAKSFAMGAPYTREAISALSDAELQQFYFQYGIAIYYPDLSRDTRENMLFELARIYKYLGTPYAVELLCNYVFDGADRVQIEIKDNLAFGDGGVLIDESLLDLFDIVLHPTSPELSNDKAKRIVDNVFRFCRNSQTLRSIDFDFEDHVDLPVCACALDEFVLRFGDDNISADVPVIETLPTVTLSDRYWISIHPNHQDFAPNYTREGWVWSFTVNTWVVSQYDPSLSYASGFWRAGNLRTGRYGIMLGDYGNGAISITNVLGTKIVSMIEANYATCSSNQAIAVPVVKISDGVFYTAFKYNLLGTDYYWVLDDVQSDWTDDLSSIGYRLPITREFIFGFSWNADETALVAVEMQSGWNYWSRVGTDAEATILQSMNLWYNSGYKYGSCKYDARFALVEIYSDVGNTPASVNLSDFSLVNMNNVLGLQYNGASTTVPIASYKVLINL